MARKSRTAEGGNSTVELPGDPVEALRWAHARILKLSAERRQYAERIRDALKDAKGKGTDVAAIRTASRLRRMTPEKRAAWEKSISQAVRFLGYTLLKPPDVAPDIAKIPGGGYVLNVEGYQREQTELGKEISEIYAACKAAALDVDSLRLFVRMSNRDATEMVDWFDRIDMTGKDLGVWTGEMLDDLRGDA